LWTTDSANWGSGGIHGSISEVVDHLSRTWLVERRARNNKKYVNIEELGRRAREAPDQKIRDLHKRLIQIVYEEDDPAIQVLRRVWPRKKGSNNWRNDWSSFPLQV
jgi:hypothetical protein